MPRHMGRGMGLAKLALGMGALRAANTAVRAAAWSSYPRYHSYYPYSYYGYNPYYYGTGYYGYSYGSSRGAGWFVAAVCVAIVGACCLLIPGIAGIICCGVGIAAALGFTITGVVKANSAPSSTVVIHESNTKSNEQTKSQQQEQSQSQNKGNCAEKPRVAPKENQMGIIKKNGNGFNPNFQVVRSNTEPKQQMALSKQQRENETNFATKYKNKDNKKEQYNVENQNAKYNQKIQSNMKRHLGHNG